MLGSWGMVVVAAAACRGGKAGEQGRLGGYCSRFVHGGSRGPGVTSVTVYPGYPARLESREQTEGPWVDFRVQIMFCASRKWGPASLREDCFPLDRGLS